MESKVTEFLIYLYAHLQSLIGNSGTAVGVTTPTLAKIPVEFILAGVVLVLNHNIAPL